MLSIRLSGLKATCDVGLHQLAELSTVDIGLECSADGASTDRKLDAFRFGVQIGPPPRFPLPRVDRDERGLTHQSEEFWFDVSPAATDTGALRESHLPSLARRPRRNRVAR